MALSKYGVLKGTVTGHKRDADDDHYQILVSAGNTVYRIAVNVKSSAPNAPSTLLFLSQSKLQEVFAQGLRALNPGYTKLPSKSGGLGLDYVRNQWFKPNAMKEVPPDAPGVDNDLKDKVETAVLKAVEQAGSFVYAFGEKWGPEKDRKDQYFKFLPGNGIHDIHMNQGNGGKYKKDNGAYQDGGLVFQYPDGKWQVFFFAFQSQTFDTDEQGNPKTGDAEAKLKAALTSKGVARKGKSKKKSKKH
jgi:uncharacterized protein YukJ